MLGVPLKQNVTANTTYICVFMTLPMVGLYLEPFFSFLLACKENIFHKRPTSVCQLIYYSFSRRAGLQNITFNTSLSNLSVPGLLPAQQRYYMEQDDRVFITWDKWMQLEGLSCISEQCPCYQPDAPRLLGTLMMMINTSWLALSPSTFSILEKRETLKGNYMVTIREYKKQWQHIIMPSVKHGVTMRSWLPSQERMMTSCIEPYAVH